MWYSYNPNPLGLNVGDCTVRAICAVTNGTWDDVHKALCDLARDMADMPSADRVWWEMLRQLGFARQVILDTCPDCYTIKDFCKDHPYGKYILGPHEHAVAVVDGNYFDSWDSGDTVPTYYFAKRR